MATNVRIADKQPEVVSRNSGVQAEKKVLQTYEETFSVRFKTSVAEENENLVTD